MNKVILAGLLVLVACVLVHSNRLPGACYGKEVGDECYAGEDGEGTCVESVICDEEPGCGLICKVADYNESKKRACCHYCWPWCGCCGH